MKPSPLCFAAIGRRGLLVLLALTGLAGTAHAAQPADDFLEPDQAFQFSAQAEDAHTLALRFVIAPGHYLYRERVKVNATPPEALAAISFPPAQTKLDPNFDKPVEIYHDGLALRVPVTGAAAADFRVSVQSQGCAEKGLCYPPREHVLAVQMHGGAITQVRELDTPDTPWASPTTATTAATANPPAEGGSLGGIEGALRSGSLLSVAGMFLLAGLMLSFTPCVLPMVPILSSIIVGQGQAVSRGRGFALALAYALGMALVYTALGVAAGLAGQGLAAALQKPAVLAAFAGLLVLLALSMFGVYELQMPSALQSRLTQASGRLQGGRFFGVFLMGGLSALIVGPCVAAPLAGALVYISQTRDVVLGGLALFSLACGMSVPLLLVGLSAGSLLPRAGRWMETVKHLFGVLLIGVAIWMVSPVLPVWAQMLAWGALLLIVATFLHVFDRLPDGARHGSRLAKGVGVLLALAGTAQVVGAMSGGDDVLQPLRHFAAARGGQGSTGTDAAVAARAPDFRAVRNVAELDQALHASGRPVMLDVYADWCVSCKELERFTFQDAAVKARLAGLTLLRADVTANSADDQALMKRFQLFGPPGMVFFNAAGRELPTAAVVGFRNATDFIAHLDRSGL